LPPADDLRPATFPEEVARDLRTEYRKLAIRYVIAFAVLFALAYAVVRWSSSSVRFASARTGGRAVPTWVVSGVVRNAATHAPVPWASIGDDPAGLPPHSHTDADLHGAFELLTMAEPHVLRITAPGYRPATVHVGRTWFLWRPRGREQRDVELTPEP
jgi:hypothetical protein